MMIPNAAPAVLCPMPVQWVLASSLHRILVCSWVMREEPQRSCDLVSLCNFLPNLPSSAAESKQVKSLHGDVVPAFACPQCPAKAILGTCYTLQGQDQPCRPRCTWCHSLGHQSTCTGPIHVLTLPSVAAGTHVLHHSALQTQVPVHSHSTGFPFKQLWFSHLLPGKQGRPTTTGVGEVLLLV